MDVDFDGGRNLDGASEIEIGFEVDEGPDGGGSPSRVSVRSAEGMANGRDVVC